MDIQTSLFILFGIVVVLFLAIDLGFLNRKSHKIEFKSALNQSLFWVAISIAFGFLVFLYLGQEMGVSIPDNTEPLFSIFNVKILDEVQGKILG